MSYNKYKIKFMQTNKKLEGDIIGLEKYKHVSDPVIHKSDLDKAFKEQLKDVVRKSDLDKAFKEQLKDVVRQKDLNKAFKEQLKDVVRYKDLITLLTPIYKKLDIKMPKVNNE